MVNFLKRLFGNKEQSGSLVQVKAVVETDKDLNTESFSYLNIDFFGTPSGENINYGYFLCTGLNPTTKRVNKKRFKAKNEQKALEELKLSGLVEPYSCSYEPAPPPTEHRISNAEYFGIAIPENACDDDYLYLRERLQSDNSGNDFESPHEDFAIYADRMGICFSKYIGKNALYQQAYRELKGDDLIAFIAYLIHFERSMKDPGNLFDTPFVDAFYETAKHIPQSTKKTLEDEFQYGWEHLHKNTTTYKKISEAYNEIRQQTKSY